MRLGAVAQANRRHHESVWRRLQTERQRWAMMVAREMGVSDLYQIYTSGPRDGGGGRSAKGVGAERAEGGTDGRRTGQRRMWGGQAGAHPEPVRAAVGAERIFGDGDARGILIHLMSRSGGRRHRWVRARQSVWSVGGLWGVRHRKIKL